MPFHDRLSGELDRHHQASAFRAGGDLVFCHPETGHPYDASKLRKRFAKARKRAGIERKIRFHDLRHTFGTVAAAAGVSMRTLMEYMGHRDLSTTLVYADFAPSTHEADLLGRAFEARTNPRTNVSDIEGHSTTPKPA